MADTLIDNRPLDSSFLVSTFYLGEALLGIDTLCVQEIIRPGKPTVVHHCPDFILGVINLRGRIVTIIDLTRKLALSQDAAPVDGGRVIIVDWRGEYVGLLVDRVDDVIAAERKAVQPPPSNVSGVQGRFIQGIYPDGTHLVAILDVEEILSDRES